MDDEGKELGMSRAAGQMGRSVLYMGRFEHTGGQQDQHLPVSYHLLEKDDIMDQ